MSQELPPLTLEKLPLDVNAHIISFLNRDRSVPLVCQQFRQLAESEYIPNNRDLQLALEENNQIMLARIARAKKFNFNQTNLNYSLITAVSNGNLEIVKLLLKFGANPSYQNNRAIKLASQDGYWRIVEILMRDRRVDPSDNGNIAIALASHNGHLAVIERLLQETRVDPTAFNNYAIKYASMYGHLAVVKRLLEDERVQQSVNFVDDISEAIENASINGHLAIVKLLENAIRNR